MVKKAVCLISGGLDSCVTAHIAKKEGYETYALSFNYGQRHNKEINCAKEVAKYVKAKKHIIFDIDLSVFGGSSLIDKSIDMPKNLDLKDIGKTIPSTYVPARNTVFLSIGLAYAESLDADAIFIGATSTDYSGYPDCRPKYFEAFQKMANLATKKGLEGMPIEIKTPLLNMSKAEIIKKGFDLNAPFEKTWSCYKGGENACGKCDSCLLRLKGFKEAGSKDPIGYEHLPDWYHKKV
ncbi:MAG: 7-cyano-7-deazaguanine synthase QueC [Candidatus Thermoplasmatota archaeon]|nr:7-cyano-7-deazaguanine synthase QueC [Candidatus Thermoplasmatota archaeon]